MSGLEYYIDIVFCIDCSASMETNLKEVKERVLRIPRDLVLRRRELGMETAQLRTRIVSFADEVLTPESTFINFGAEIFNWKHHDSIRKMKINRASKGNNHAGLEALANAMESDWVETQDLDKSRKRHLIMMFTDASAHRLEDRVGAESANFLRHVPSNLDELEGKWRLQFHYGSNLVLFAPDMYPWATIGDSWARTLFLPSNAGVGLIDSEIQTIIDVLAIED